MLTVRLEFGVRLQTLSRTVATVCRRLRLHLPNRSHHTCGLAWPTLAAVWTSKLNIFLSAGFQWEPVGNCRSLQQQECTACSLVYLQFIVLTWTCNNNPSPSLFFPGLSISIQNLRSPQPPTGQDLQGQKWRSLGNFSSPSAKHCLVSAGGCQEALQGRYRPLGAVADLANHNHIALWEQTGWSYDRSGHADAMPK